MFIKLFMENLSDMWSGKNILGAEETAKTVRVFVGDLPPANKPEPLDPSHGARVMAKQVGVVILMFFSTMNLAPYV